MPNNTTKHNIEILTNNLGYRHLGNTQVFQKNNSYILSPAVKKNTQGYYWFDVSKKNLERMNNKNFLMLVRIVPDLFIFEKSETIRPLLSINLMGNGRRQNIWGIIFNIKYPNNSVNLLSIEDKSKKVSVELLDTTEDIIKRYNDLCSVQETGQMRKNMLKGINREDEIKELYKQIGKLLETIEHN